MRLPFLKYFYHLPEAPSWDATILRGPVDKWEYEPGWYGPFDTFTEAKKSAIIDLKVSLDQVRALRKKDCK